MRSQLGGGSQTDVQIVPADKRKHVEQSGTYRLAGRRHSDGVNERSRLHTSRIGCASQGRLG